MSSIVIAPRGGAEQQGAKARGARAERPEGGEPALGAARSELGAEPTAKDQDRVPEGGSAASPSALDSLPGRTRGWRAVRPRSVDAVARTGRRVAVHAHDAGMATAEYAIATLAAVGFAGLLVVLLKSDVVRGLLTAIIKKALQG